MCKRACFAMQKGTFYKPVCNLLIPWWLQRQFLMIMSWFANNSAVQFVRVFQESERIPITAWNTPHHSLSSEPLRRKRGSNKRDTPLCLRRTEWGKKASPRPSPKGEGGNKRDTPLCLRRHKMVFEWFKELVLRLTSKRVTCSKLRIYELQIGELQDKDHEFTNWQIVNCVL